MNENLLLHKYLINQFLKFKLHKVKYINNKVTE
jgi:hypothetical protein